MGKWQELSNQIDFLADESEDQGAYVNKYKILIADDDSEIHDVTKLVLRDFDFDGSTIEFIDAYSGTEVIQCLEDHEDIAVIFLDVVMENRDTGLSLVKKIRQDLGNRQVRIILRTGQPGDAPEQEVIRNYDINDYRLKTEMTAEKMETLVYGALRNYRDLMSVERNRQMNEKLLHISSNLFAQHSINDFFDNVLFELSKMKKLPMLESGGSKGNYSGYAAVQQDYYKVIAATGNYAEYIGQEINSENAVFQALDEDKRRPYGEHIFLVDDGFLIEYKGNSNLKTVIYVEGNTEHYDFELITLFLTNFSIALDNYLLNNLLQTSQRDIIFALGETVENHFEDTGQHIKRTSEMMFRFATCLSLSYQEAELLSLASTLHDLGKIVIPDSILKKPDSLSTEEFEVMKTHAKQGYNILCNSELPMLKAASSIALYHHEHFNGKGYPEGLAGHDIPRDARMMAIVDSFDAMTHKRVYKEAISIEEARRELTECKGGHFDPELVNIFLENLDYIIGGK